MSAMTLMNRSTPIPTSLKFNGIPSSTFTALTAAGAATAPSTSIPPTTLSSSAAIVATPTPTTSSASAVESSINRTKKSSAFVRRVSTESGIPTGEKQRCKTVLPDDFVPTPYTVVCGRGRKCTTAVGNRRLQVIATMFIPKYSQCNRKEDKTEIVSQILAMVKSACPEERHAFVKFHDGRWWEVETLIAREKIGAVLRDCLHDKYRSSTKSKLERRRLQKLKDREEADDTDDDEQPSHRRQSQHKHIHRRTSHAPIITTSSSSPSSFVVEHVPSNINTAAAAVAAARAAANIKRVSTTSILMMGMGNDGNSLDGFFQC